MKSDKNTNNISPTKAALFTNLANTIATLSPALASNNSEFTSVNRGSGKNGGRNMSVFTNSTISNDVPLPTTKSTSNVVPLQWSRFTVHGMIEQQISQHSLTDCTNVLTSLKLLSVFVQSLYFENVFKQNAIVHLSLNSRWKYV